jgi:hypothetical protein
MSMSLAELDQWNPDAIAEVFSAVTDHSESTRQTSHGLGQVMGSVPWDGDAHEAAVKAANGIQKDLDLHGDQLDAVANAARIAEAEVRRVKSDWQKICRMADRWGITIDIETNEIVAPSPPPTDPDDVAELAHRMDILHEEIVELLDRADNADRDLAAAINGAIGVMSAAEVDRELSDETSVAGHGAANGEERKDNQRTAFREVFGRDPVSSTDWSTAAALDPHTYDPKFRGTDSQVSVVRINPVPGQGEVRVSQFIEQRDVTSFPPPTRDLGNDRGPDAHFDPEDTKVTTYIDYENGLVVMRQNPSVIQNPDGSSGQVKVAAPTGSVKQLADGSVRIRYDAANPFAPGVAKDPTGPMAGHTATVNGDLVFTPGADGVTVNGTRSDYPSLEVYQDRPNSSTHTVLIDPADSGRSLGPAFNLPFHHDIGIGGKAFAPFEVKDGYNPTYDVRVPLPATPFGPVTSPPSAVPERAEGAMI